jgi:hypothetical protein
VAVVLTESSLVAVAESVTLPLALAASRVSAATLTMPESSLVAGGGGIRHVDFGFGGLESIGRDFDNGIRDYLGSGGPNLGQFGTITGTGGSHAWLFRQEDLAFPSANR